MNFEEARKILNLNENPSIEEIENAFKKKVKECHPDVGGTNEEFQKTIDARDYLIMIFEAPKAIMIVQDTLNKTQTELGIQNQIIMQQQQNLASLFKNVSIQSDIVTLRDREKTFKKELNVKFVLYFFVFCMLYLFVNLYLYISFLDLRISLNSLLLILTSGWIIISTNWTYFVWIRNRIINRNLIKLKEAEMIEKIYASLFENNNAKHFISLKDFNDIIKTFLRRHFKLSPPFFFRTEEISLYISTIQTTLIEWELIKKTTLDKCPGYQIE